MTWDLYVSAFQLQEAADMAKRLGWSGIGVLVPLKDKAGLKGIKEACQKVKGIDLSLGVIISGKGAAAARASQSVRREVELVAVSGGDLETNRAALETPEVDMLLHPWEGRQDCGLDEVMVKLAKENNVSICFDLHPMLVSSRSGRVQVMDSMLDAAGLVKKLKAPFVISSGAIEPYDLRSASDLTSFGRVLGFGDPEIKKAMSGGMVAENRKRLSGKWVMPGVEEV